MRRRLLFGLVLSPAAVLVAGACSTSHDASGPASADASAGADVDLVDAGAAMDDAPWDHRRIPYDGASIPDVPRVPVAAEVVSTHIDTHSLLFAAGEMQISGEPFAEFFGGRNLGNYDRTHVPPDQYLLPGAEQVPVTDLFGFSTAVESYEYSKYHMNMVVQQTGAGISLANGPLVATLPQLTPQDRLIERIRQLLVAAGTDVGGYAQLPPPPGNPRNVLGFGGLMPSFAPYRGFDAAMAPSNQVVKNCNAAGGYGGIPSLGQVVPEYECEYNEMNLPDAQLDRVLVPTALGFATWKQALWAIDFAGRVHDAGSNPINAVADADRAKVGTAHNTVVATDPAGAAVGTFLGSTALEGMWGVIMVANMDNLSELLVSSLTTADGVALSGFPTKANAIAYDYTMPLRWFPTAVTVNVDATQHYPTLTSMQIANAASRSEDLAALLLGNAMFFAMTDARNAAVGQRLGLQLSFDGDPFAADNGLADGEDTAHDRALSVLRVAFVDLDRMHTDPALGVAVDDATVSGGAVTRGDTVTTTSLAHVIIGLRQTLLSLNAAITQYGASDPDPAADMNGILNTSAIHPPGGGTPNFSAHVRATLLKNAAFVRDVLTTKDGHVASSAKIAGGVATPSTDAVALETQAAAARALTEGFLISGDETFRTRARAVVLHLFDAFYSPPARMFRGVENGKDEIHMNAERFAWLQSALRETHKVLFVQDDAVLGREALEDKIARTNKLYLNGWDDLNGNEKVDHGGADAGASECLAGRLQLAEQSLTGELGRDDFGRSVPDRDGDCVIELSHAQRASVLAGDVFFHSP